MQHVIQSNLFPNALDRFQSRRTMKLEADALEDDLSALQLALDLAKRAVVADDPREPPAANIALAAYEVMCRVLKAKLANVESQLKVERAEREKERTNLKAAQKQLAAALKNGRALLKAMKAFKRSVAEIEASPYSEDSELPNPRKRKKTGSGRTLRAQCQFCDLHPLPAKTMSPLFGSADIQDAPGSSSRITSRAENARKRRESGRQHDAVHSEEASDWIPGGISSPSLVLWWLALDGEFLSSKLHSRETNSAGDPVRTGFTQSSGVRKYYTQDFKKPVEWTKQARRYRTWLHTTSEGKFENSLPQVFFSGCYKFSCFCQNFLSEVNMVTNLTAPLILQIFYEVRVRSAEAQK
ncbi:hypothetical protein B0H16DRAFT_1475704 [Mycena metata]|uniref:Uncharacterized protein n=1 Tax=Mycena metata TaxID=1033252 RepID=A0AAD7MIS2_9AGAR|nr:hypothetical protein B0H16DRAFT_1475704 [Mycena metata]